MEEMEIAIFIVASLLVIFSSAYFFGIRPRRKLKAGKNEREINIDEINHDGILEISAEWAEQLHILHAQLDLMFELSPAFLVCLDFGRDFFSISENGRELLALDINSGQKAFEDLIHNDDLFLYEEIIGAENIRKSELADSPYVIRLRKNKEIDEKDKEKENVYGEFLARIKPIFSENGIAAAIVIAFIETKYILK